MATAGVSPFGSCLMGLTKRGICYLAFADQEGDPFLVKDLSARWPNAEFLEAQAETAKVCRDVFRPVRKDPVRLLLKGTNFQLKVWEALLRIPCGAVTSYGAVAACIGNSAASRAVGTAVGANPLACLIPCHRVLQASGAFHNYRWGPVRKKAILAREWGFMER